MKKVLEEERIDVQIRYWNKTAKLVGMQFFDSQFLRRPNARKYWY